MLSRFPIAGVAPHDLGVAVEVDGRRVWLLHLHHDEPYGPYQLLGIPYAPAPLVETAAEAAAVAAATRDAGMDLLDEALAAAGGDIVVVTGDFNEPSGRAWTEAAAAAGLHPIAVPRPTTARLEAQGFVEAYRAMHPDPVARPTFTWTPRADETATDDHPDGVDYVFARGAEAADAWILSETGPRTDLAVEPWPSDHRAVPVELAFSGTASNAVP